LATREELIRDGWEECFTAFGERLKEAVEMYEELGFEVRLEQAEAPRDAPDESCKTCFRLFDKTIWVRRRG